MKTVDESMTEEQIKSALRPLFQSEDVLCMAIKMSLDEYRAIESWVREESAAKITKLERELGSWVKRADKTWHEKESAALREPVAEIEAALPAMREYARKNPKHHFSTDGTEQDPNGAHAWLERNDKPNAELCGGEAVRTSAGLGAGG